MRNCASWIWSGVPVMQTCLSGLPSSRSAILMLAPLSKRISLIFCPPRPIIQPIRSFGMFISCVCTRTLLAVLLAADAMPDGLEPMRERCCCDDWDCVDGGRLLLGGRDDDEDEGDDCCCCCCWARAAAAIAAAIADDCWTGWWCGWWCGGGVWLCIIAETHNTNY